MVDVHELIPLFPLSSVVLFPRVKIPLFLFEPRYRQLAADVLAGSRRIGMTTVHPDHLGDIEHDPPLTQVGCCGVVTESQQLDDGTYNIVLLGEHRFRLVGEQPRASDRLYRIGRIERLDDPNPAEDREPIARLRANIVENVGTLVRRAEPERAAMLDPALFRGVDDETFVNVLANALAFPPEEKRRLLEADSILERYAGLAAALSFWRADIESDCAGGVDPIH